MDGDKSNTSDQDFSGFSAEECEINLSNLSKQENDPFDLHISELTDCLTIKFYHQGDFDIMQSVLKDLYVFQQTKDQSGMSAETNILDKRVVITAYATKTLLVQGSGCRLWYSKIFHKLKGHIISSNSTPHDEETTVKKTIPKKSKSTSILKNLSNKLFRIESRGPVSPLNYTNPEFRRVPKPAYDLYYGQRQPKLCLPTQANYNDEETIKKCLSHTEEEATTKLATDTDINESLNEHKTSQSTQTPLEDKTQTKTVKHSSTQTKKESTSENSQKISKYESKLKELSSKLADANAKILILSEENAKLKEQKKLIGTELQKLESKNFLKSEELADFRSEMSDLKENMSTITSVLAGVKKDLTCKASINDIATVRLELQHIKEDASTKDKTTHQQVSRIISEQNHTAAAKSLQKQCLNTHAEDKNMATQSMKSQEIRASPKPNLASTSTAPRTEQKQSDTKKTVLILGDSVTKVIKTEKMTSGNISTRIQSTPGAKIKTIHANVEKMLESDMVEVPDAIITHVGINNISDGDDKSSILKDYTSLMQLLCSKLKNTKLIISSILPMQNVKVTTPIIKDINEALKQHCQENGHTFLDNTPLFLNSHYLYHGEVHLSVKGAATLGTSMKKGITSALGVPFHADNSSLFRHAQQHRPMSIPRRPSTRMNPWAYRSNPWRWGPRW